MSQLFWPDLTVFVIQTDQEEKSENFSETDSTSVRLLFVFAGTLALSFAARLLMIVVMVMIVFT